MHAFDLALPGVDIEVGKVQCIICTDYQAIF
jgi:hypothetical protein